VGAIPSDAPTTALPRLVALDGGEFLMGTDDPEGFPADREGPIRRVTVEPYSIAETAVTNEQFQTFVTATGYRTDAEEYGWSYVFHLLLHPGSEQHVMDGYVPGAPWWRAVRDADWAHPFGPTSDLTGLEDHPVVHVSARDALAYCDWAGVRLPTEAEWEFAARGGLEQRRFAWGDDLHPDGEHRCNIWQGTFPTQNTAEDGYVGTCPVTSFPPNGYGLYNMAGNVWELCDEAWHIGDALVIRGGSYLCHDSYCNRYRVAARTSTTADSSTGNTGFRIAKS
jgi:formylglycine-generating enzyme required for sulfatase activity